MLTFGEYLSRLDEDLQQEIAKISSDISTIDAQLNQRTQPLITRKNQLTKLLALKQKQQALENRRLNVQQPTAQPENPSMGSNAVASTPGGSTSSQPGSVAR